MPMKARVTNVAGRILAETRDGTRRLFQHDALGNVIAAINDAGVVTDTYEYWSYGEIRTQTGTSNNPWKFCGAWGYYTDASGRQYVRARTLRNDLGRWMTIDGLWPYQPAFGYANNSPALTPDPTGNIPIKLEIYAFIGAWRATKGYLPLKGLPNLGLSVNGNYGDQPMSFKVYTFAQIDSCAIGSGKVYPDQDNGTSTLASRRLTLFGWSRWLPIWTGRGPLYSTVLADVYGKCSNTVLWEVSGFAAAPIIKTLPFPIFMRTNIVFSAGPDLVTVNFDIVDRTAFPDFEVRLSHAASPTYLQWTRTSRFSGPELGLIPQNNTNGPWDQVTFALPTSKKCCGSC